MNLTVLELAVLLVTVLLKIMPMVFDIGAGFNGEVYALAVRDDAFIYVSGNFTQYKSVACNAGLVRLKPDGAIDTAFAVSPFDVGVDYYAPTQLQVMPDGGVVVGLSNTRLVFTKPGAHIHKMKYNGADTSCLLKFKDNGSVDNTFANPFVGSPSSTWMYEFTLCGTKKMVACYRLLNIGVPHSSAVLFDIETGQWSRLSVAAERGFVTTTVVDRFVLIGGLGITVGSVYYVTPATSVELSQTQFPRGLSPFALLDLNLNLLPQWIVSSGRVAGEPDVNSEIYRVASFDNTTIFGAMRTSDGAFKGGDWGDDVNIVQHRGAFLLITDNAGYGSSRWNLMTDAAFLDKNGFFPAGVGYTDADDGYENVVIPLAGYAGSGGKFFISYPFGKLKNVALSPYTVYALERSGVLSSLWTAPTLGASGGKPGRVVTGALTPNGQALIVGGRFSSVNAAAKGNVAVLNPVTGVSLTPLNIAPRLRVPLVFNGGVRGFVWSAFAEGLYKKGSEK